MLQLILSVPYVLSPKAFPFLLRRENDSGSYDPPSLPLISSLDILQKMKEKQLEDARGLTMFPRGLCVRIQVFSVSYSALLSNDLLSFF